MLCNDIHTQTYGLINQTIDILNVYILTKPQMNGELA